MSINYNTANATNFKLEIPGNEEVVYFLQGVVLPGITMDHVQIDYTNVMTMMAGIQVTYSPFTASFILDEDFKNYLFIREWLLLSRDTETFHDVFKDVKLHILTANKTANLVCTFVLAHPTSLSDLTFNSGVPNVEHFVFDVQFGYQQYYIERVNEDT